MQTLSMDTALLSAVGMQAAMLANGAAPALVLRINVLFIDGVQVHSMGFLPPICQETLTVCL